MRSTGVLPVDRICVMRRCGSRWAGRRPCRQSPAQSPPRRSGRCPESSEDAGVEMDACHRWLLSGGGVGTLAWLKLKRAAPVGLPARRRNRNRTRNHANRAVAKHMGHQAGGRCSADERQEGFAKQPCHQGGFAKHICHQSLENRVFEANLLSNLLLVAGLLSNLLLVANLLSNLLLVAGQPSNCPSLVECLLSSVGPACACSMGGGPSSTPSMPFGEAALPFADCMESLGNAFAR